MENKKSLLRLRLRVTARKRSRSLKRCDSVKMLREKYSCNSVKKLQQREIGAFRKMGRGAASNAQEKFRNFQLQMEIMWFNFCRRFSYKYVVSFSGRVMFGWRFCDFLSCPISRIWLSRNLLLILSLGFKPKIGF